MPAMVTMDEMSEACDFELVVFSPSLSIS